MGRRDGRLHGGVNSYQSRTENRRDRGTGVECGWIVSEFDHFHCIVLISLKCGRLHSILYNYQQSFSPRIVDYFDEAFICTGIPNTHPSENPAQGNSSSFDDVLHCADRRIVAARMVSRQDRIHAPCIVSRH